MPISCSRKTLFLGVFLDKISFPGQTVDFRLYHVIHIWKAMTLSYNLAYQEIISVHPTKRQIFAGKSDSAFWNIWEWVIMKTGANFSLSKTKYYEFAILHASSLQPLEGSRGKRCIKKWFCQAKKKDESTFVLKCCYCPRQSVWVGRWGK